MWLFATTVVIWGITHGVHSQQSCPTSWRDALLGCTANMLHASGSQYVILFAEKDQISGNFLARAHSSGARLLLVACDGSMSDVGRFLAVLKGRCVNYCTFLLLCNDLSDISTILDAAEYAELIRPWTLWFFMRREAVDIIKSRELGDTGVPIAVPFENNNTTESDCGVNSTGIQVVSLIGNITRTKAVFHYDTVIDHHYKDNIFLAGAIDGKYNILNMQNATITAAAGEFSPFFMFTDTGHKGICFEMLNAFKKSMNFSCDPRKIAATGIYRNGSWTGIIGAVANKSINVGLGGISVTSSRAEVVDFTNPFMEDMSGVLSPHPGQRNNVFMFVRIFPWQVWVLLLITIILMGPTLALLESYPRADIIALSWLVVANVLQQGELKPKKNASRVLASFWLFFLVVFMGTYSGLMLAIMSFPGMEAPIETLEQLAKENRILPTVFSQSSTRMYIENGTSPSHVKLQNKWKAFATTNFANSSLDALSKLSTGRYAFIGEKVNFRELIYLQLKSSDTCPFYESKQDFLRHYYALVLNKNSPLKGSFNNILRQLREKGLIFHWNTKYQRDISKCEESHSTSGESTRPLRLHDLLGAIATLSLGIGASFIMLLVELVVNHRQQKNSKHAIIQRKT